MHGVSGSSSAWGPYEEYFRNHYNIISFDLRGHGKSIRYKKYDDYKIELFSDDIYDLIKYLGINKFILVSHSFGSIIALSFLKYHQDMLEAVVLVSPEAKVSNMLGAKIVKPLLDLAVKILPAPTKNRTGNHIDYSKYLNSGDWNIPRTFADVKNTGLRIYLYCSKQTYNFDGQEVLEKIHIPTLIIHGKNDTIFPLKGALKIHKAVPQSKIVVIENSDHILVLNNFREVSELIKNFVADLTMQK